MDNIARLGQSRCHSFSDQKCFCLCLCFPFATRTSAGEQLNDIGICAFIGGFEHAVTWYEFEDEDDGPTAAADWSQLGNCVYIVVQVITTRVNGSYGSNNQSQECEVASIRCTS